ncbi:hypothetical protein RB595_004859 [Gaeumannomyces hyphopodioides]
MMTDDEQLEEHEVLAEMDRTIQARKNEAKKRHSEQLAREEERRMRRKRVQFHTEDPMIGPPRYTWADLKTPLLRKSQYELKDIRWIQHLGGGIDGYCWKVVFGVQGPFVLKMFWDDEPPSGFRYWAAQREFQNAAVLQMIEASMDDLRAAGDGDQKSIRLLRKPENRTGATENLYAFSEEARHQPRIARIVNDVNATVELEEMHRQRKCFGWLKLSSDYFSNHPARRKISPPGIKVGKYQRQINPCREYFAIVYEFIPDDDGTDDPSPVDRGKIQASMDFLSVVGFEFADSRILDNWKSGVLIDLSDIIFPLGVGKGKNRHTRGDALSLRSQEPVRGLDWVLRQRCLEEDAAPHGAKG